MDQYCDPLDPPPGVHRTVRGGGDRIPKATRRSLEHGSVSAQGALALSRIKGVADPVRTPATSPPAAPGTPPAPAAAAGSAASESGPTVGGGFIVVIVAAAVALAVLAFVVRRRRSAP